MFTAYAQSKYVTDSGAGHSILEDKSAGDIRMFLQNPNSIMGKDTFHDDRRALLELREWGADIIALPETNKNWKK